MTRWIPLLVLFFCAVMAFGCDENCGAGECVDEDECAENCIDACDGEVISAFCSVDGFCDCECELGCF